MRIAGITIPEKKRLEITLTALYGVGRPQAKRILAKAGIDAGRTAESLSTEEESKIREIIESEGMLLEGELRREKGSHIKRLKDISAYRGMRHSTRLPARGQRTKTNARTLKGAKKTAGSGKRKVEKK
jgi:small subunit ribosomal protein S13